MFRSGAGHPNFARETVGVGWMLGSAYMLVYIYK